MGVNGAHNTVEGNVGAYNTIEGNVGAYNTICVRAVAEYCSCRRIGYGPWYSGLTCAPWLAFSVRPLVLSEWASLVRWP